MASRCPYSDRSYRACFQAGALVPHALITLFLAVSLGGFPATAVHGDDWPQWLGPQRDGVWREKGIIEKFPEKGPRLRWKAALGGGYSGPAVAAGRVFVMDRVAGEVDPGKAKLLHEGKPPRNENFLRKLLPGKERLVCLAESDGRQLWAHEWDCPYTTVAIYAIGPRATPTVDGDRVYVVGATGRLWCLDVESGTVIWQKNYVEQYGTNVPVWGVTSAPLVDGNRLITIVGGEPDALVVAFDKQTGEELWRAVEVVQEMGYGQPVIYDAGGVRQLIIWHTGALVSLDPTTGDMFWEEPWEVPSGLSVATPVRSGNYLLVSQFYHGSLMMRLDTDRPDATMLWKGSSRSELPDETEGLHALITTPIILDDYVYGVGSYGELRGLSARTGERLWMSSDMTVQNRWGWLHLCAKVYLPMGRSCQVSA